MGTELTTGDIAQNTELLFSMNACSRYDVKSRDDLRQSMENNELERRGKAAVVAYSKVLYYPGICGRKVKKNLRMTYASPTGSNHVAIFAIAQ
jgi:hypothetical protein